MNIPPHPELLDLSGKVAIVTGASQGIGAAIARRFAEAGASVVVHYRSREDAAGEVVNSIVSAGGTAVAVQAELSAAEGVDSMVAATMECFGRLDIAVNNAGSFPNQSLLEMSAAEWRELYRSNVETAFLCTQGAARHMREAGAGAIVNLGSIAALCPGPDHSHYNSAKAAILMLTRSAAQELGPYGIRVNAVSPGLIERPGIEAQWPDGVRRWRRRAPLTRLGQPEDVADACLFLASAASRWITGHNLVVDGGILASQIY